MKKFAKMMSLTLALALCALCAVMLTACNKGTKYNYSKVEVNMDMGDDMPGMDSMFASMNSVYDTMYKDSTIVVGDKEIVWTVKDAEQKCKYTKDGDKYIMLEDSMSAVTDAIKNMYNNIPGASVETSDVSIYGIEVDGGFDMVMSEKFTVKINSETMNMSFSMTIKFTKA